MKFSQKFVQSIQQNPKFGAGNFIFQLEALGVDKISTCIYLDLPIRDVNGELRSTFNITDLIRNADTWAAFYQSQNIVAKDPVALYFSDNFDYFIHFLALTRIGAIPICINHNLSPEIVVEFIRRVGANHVMMEAQLKSRFEQNTTSDNDNLSILVLESIKHKEDYAPIKVFSHTEDDVALLAHTSGTTGIPKAVIFTHNGFYEGVKSQLDKQVGDSVLCALPHSHSAAISILMSSLLRGVPVRIQSKKRAEDIVSSIKVFKPQLIVAFPKTFTDLCRLDLNPVDFSSISYWLSTGDANHEPHIRKLIALGNCVIKGEAIKGSIFIDNLGSSEFGFAIFRNIHTPLSNRYARCIGKPFDWVECDILTEEGELAAVNDIGYLGVKSKSVTAGYWNNHLLTEKNRLSGYWLTGDFAYKNEEGIFFHVDRITDKIMTSEGPMYSCLVEELILSQRLDIFECSIYEMTIESDIKQAAIVVEMKKGVKASSFLLRELNQLLLENGYPILTKLSFGSAHDNVGATGKKLKRNLREGLSA